MPAVPYRLMSRQTSTACGIEQKDCLANIVLHVVVSPVTPSSVFVPKCTAHATSVELVQFHRTLPLLMHQHCIEIRHGCDMWDGHPGSYTEIHLRSACTLVVHPSMEPQAEYVNQSAVTSHAPGMSSRSLDQPDLSLASSVMAREALLLCRTAWELSNQS